MNDTTLPAKYGIIRNGYLQDGDLIWDEISSKWLPVTLSQASVGYPVKDFGYVARKEVLNNLFSKRLIQDGFTTNQVEKIWKNLGSVCQECYDNDVGCYCWNDE